MNGNCIDIGTIQAFLDGETAQDESLRIGQHIAACDICARVLAAAEDENSFVFSTLEREMNALVPTQRLWSRINDSIETEKARRPFWQHVYSFFAMSLRDRSMVAMAGLLIVFGLMAVVWTLRPTETTTSFVNTNPQTPTMSAPASAEPLATESSAPVESPFNPTGAQQISVSNHSAKKLEQIVREANSGPRVITADYNKSGSYEPIPAEASYIKTIADLKENVDDKKDQVFTGSSRVAFERDLAVVNDSINRMRKVVRKNPRNQAARQVLYSAYQDKIDLLNTVAQKDELLATVR
jgi:hypothetical protein